MSQVLFGMGGGKLEIGGIDLAIIIGYLVGIVGLGCWAGLRQRSSASAESDGYFLAGKSLKWPIIGLALFATNISTIHLVSLAQCGYTSGLLYGNFEWMAGFTLICLSLFFAPFYIRSKVTTLPDFLEKRYNRPCRDWLAILSIISAIFIHIGFSLYTGAVVMRGLFGIDMYVSIVTVAVLTGLYTIVGGLLAVVITESIQTVILLVGAICITIFGMVEIGGWAELQKYVHPVNFSIIRPDTDPTGLSMWAVFLGYPVIGLWYWCCDQTIVQRVLGAKDENHARVGPLFAGFIKILPMFIFVLPGLVCLGLIQKGVLTAPLEDSEDVYAYMISNLLPVGLKGLVAAALLAALMSTVSGALNSIATLFSYDIYKRWSPNTPDHKLVMVGRVVTFFAMLAAIVWSPCVGRFGSIFQGLNDLICYIAPPITVVFLWGVFWRRASGTGAIVTLLSGSAMGLGVFILDWWDIGGWSCHSMISGFGLFCICSAILVFVSLFFPHRHTEESEKLVWKNPLEPLQGQAWPGIGNFRFLAALLFLIMCGLYYVFAGGDSYYGVNCSVAVDGRPSRGARLVFECDEPVYDFSAAADKDGRFIFPTGEKAGGAPAGTKFRIKIEPVAQVVRLDKDGKVAKVLATVSPGTTIDVKEKDGKTIVTMIDKEDEKTVFDGKLPDGEKIEIIAAAELDEKYGGFETSGLSMTIEEGVNTADFKLGN
jgi:SSS family solute:Na+ symporter